MYEEVDDYRVRKLSGIQEVPELEFVTYGDQTQEEDKFLKFASIFAYYVTF